MTRKFYIQDIVSIAGDDDTLFMVVDVADYSGLAPNGQEIEDIDYELMQVYPIMKNAKYETVSQPDLNLKEKRGSKNHELLLTFIQKDREKRGWYGVPDFLEVSKGNLKTLDGVRVKDVQPPMQKLDTIRYDQLDTIDKCLDALNDLKTLHQMFGDEAYLQLQEVVTARIIRLNK